MTDHDESLMDRVRAAFGMGSEDRSDAPSDDAEEFPVLPEDPGDPGGIGHNPGPVGSARYERGVAPAEIGGTDEDPDGELDLTRQDVRASEFGAAYGQDRPPLPTEAAWDRGEAVPEDVDRAG